MPPIKTQPNHPNLPFNAKTPADANRQPSQSQPCVVEKPKNLFNFTENLALREGILRTETRFDLEAKLFAAQNNQNGGANNQASNANTNNANNPSTQTGNAAVNANQNSQNPPAANQKPEGGGIVDGVIAFGKDWISREIDADRQVITGVVEAASGIVKNEIEALGDLDKGIGNTLIGALEIAASPNETQKQEGREDFAKGLEQLNAAWLKGNPTGINQTGVDAAIMIGGRLVSAVQTKLGLEEVGRGLLPDERVELEKVFGNSVDYDKIYIKEGFAGVATWASGDRALTHGNTIYMKVHKPDASDAKYVNNQQQYQTDLKDWQTTLVHESTHVWQGQNGGTDYMSEAVIAQQTAARQDPNGSDNAAYNFEKAIGEGKKWEEFNPEQQAKFVEEAYKAGYFTTGNFIYQPDPINNPQIKHDLTQQAREIIPQMLQQQGAP